MFINFILISLILLCLLITLISTPSFKGCNDPISLALQYCNMSLSLDERFNDFISHLNISTKVAMLSPQFTLGNICLTYTGGNDDIGLSDYRWLTEANTGISNGCIAKNQCSTTFTGPLGMAASFNRTNWNLKGTVLGKELRAYNNAGAGIGLTGYGPNINIARDPRFGRTSELPGEDPFLNGHYAKEVVSGMQIKDKNGHPLMLAYLKHYAAYSMENNRYHSNVYNIF